MKLVPRPFAAIIFGLALLCGCDNKPDPRIAEMQSQIADLQSNLSQASYLIDQRRIISSNNAVLSQQMYDDLGTNIQTTFDLENRLKLAQLQVDLLWDLFTNPPAKRIPAGYGYATTRNSVPDSVALPPDVAGRIWAAAAEKFPDNHGLQLIEIMQETLDWRHSNENGQAPPAAPEFDENGQRLPPPEVQAQIRAAAAAQYPNDYTTQAYVIKTQTAAWQKLNP